MWASSELFRGSPQRGSYSCEKPKSVASLITRQLPPYRYFSASSSPSCAALGFGLGFSAGFGATSSVSFAVADFGVLVGGVGLGLVAFCPVAFCAPFTEELGVGLATSCPPRG